MVSTGATSRNSKNRQVEMSSCPNVTFDPVATAALTEEKASWPSGYRFRLEVEDEHGVPTRKAILNLPEGMAINSAIGAGLGICTPAQLAAETALSSQGEGCPNAAKIGELRVTSQLFGNKEDPMSGEEPLEGAVYVGPVEGAAGGTLDVRSGLEIPLYLVARLPERGVFIKATGLLVVDARTGQVSARVRRPAAASL